MSGRMLWVIMILSVPARVLGADEWYVSYEKGVDAVRGGQWQEAVQLLTDAITERGEERARVKTYGLRFIDYFPYAYRGVAYAKLGNTAKALEDLEHSERQGHVFNGSLDRSAGQMVRDNLEFLRRSRASDKTFADAVALYRQKEYARAIEMFKAIPSSAPTHAEAQRYLQLAQTELSRKNEPQPPQVTQQKEPPKKEPPKTDRRPTSAQLAAEYQAGVKLFGRKDYDAAEEKFNGVLRYDGRHAGAQKYINRIKAARAALAASNSRSGVRDTEQSSSGTSTKQPNSTETLYAQAIDFFRAGKLESARRAFLTVRAADPRRTEASAYLDSIDRASERIRGGIAAFCEGEYGDAITKLTDAARVNSESPHIFGFLASAYAAEYFLTGGEDRALQRNALDAFHRAKQLDAAYTLDGRLISPRIVALLNTQ